MTTLCTASSTRLFTPASASEKPAVTLARHGYLATAPLLPTLAVSFETLDAYRELHGTCPRLSVYAFCRALCALHRNSFRSVYVEQFTIAFDVYLDVLHQVDVQVARALSRDTPNWRMKNACALCLYALENEPSLPFSFLATMDGNSSLKLVDEAFRSGEQRGDSRTSRTDIIMPVNEVDIFEHEVQRSRQSSSPSTFSPAGPSPQSGTSVHEDVGEPAESKSICAERWRNAGPETHKKMFALFAATGIFVCICRHGQLLTMCDMIRSGELMKYALAIANKLMRVYGPSVRIKLGYDIACEFAKVLLRSSLGPHASRMISCVVPAFHGHSHNHGCQLNWHPMYMSGVGKEDFEGCERFFSASNDLASGTRLASAFHRHQAIEQHVAFWAVRKHVESGKFIYDNYRQALQIIEEGTRALAIYEQDLQTGPADYERYLIQEREYLSGLKSEPPELALNERYRQLDYLIIHAGITGKEITAIKREYVNSHKRVVAAEETVQRLEDMLEVSIRWIPASTEYKTMATELQIRKYRGALDNLERLVVQRLFELKKLGWVSPGYKLREKIAKALRTRAEAIRNALATYNRLAASLSPPREQLTWEGIMTMVSLGEFDLLRDARQDIRSQAWAKPTHRDAMQTYYNVERAREEIQRLNIEVQRLFSSMVDDHVDHHRATCAARGEKPMLARELEARQEYRGVLNEGIVAWLRKTAALPGFSGKLEYGHRIGRDKTLLDGVPLPRWALRVGDLSAGGVDRVNEHDVDDEGGIPGAGGLEPSNCIVDFCEALGDNTDSA
ncbi:hypothetical protein PYCCODRAFT_1370572 [Trametes coccinea BRFM310]|uniref:CxC1-like cysteine cluster associated with KDZ transposases domain-containing protein n=1 Tax=Trametes coccinea (strain BRFM310) TaxID=1353009 RepID=A0A1Y2IHN9_TRAC3|nr:hypothetical protein PYCCODRAFT_1370572 [Trametes coccinea BRFM310]